MIDTIKNNPYATFILAFVGTIGFGLIKLFGMLQSMGLGQ